MAAPGDNMEEEMMNIIANAGEQDVDDGSQYLALENEQETVLQENTHSAKYTYILLLAAYSKMYFNIKTNH